MWNSSLASSLTDQTTDYWLKILHKFIATDQFFIENLKDQLKLQNLKPKIVLNSDTGLKELMDLFMELEANIKSIANDILTNWKAALVKFEV
jgi:hypothetical protein